MNKCDLCKFPMLIVARVRPSRQIIPNITIPSIPSRFVSENNHLQNPMHFNTILVYVRPMIWLADDTSVAYWIRRRINLIWRSWHKWKYVAYHYIYCLLWIQLFSNHPWVMNLDSGWLSCCEIPLIFDSYFEAAEASLSTFVCFRSCQLLTMHVMIFIDN